MPSLTDNQRAIVGAVLDQPGIRRGAVSEMLGISAQTTMRAVLPLIEQGVLSETHVTSGGRGKPARELSFVAGSLATVGISLAVDRVHVEVADLAGGGLATTNKAQIYDSAAVQLDDLDALLEAALNDLSDGVQIIGAGVSVQGYLMAGGTRFAAKADPEGWAQTDLPAHLAARLGVPVQMMNDGRTLASSLIRQAPYQNFICLHIGSGIGGGVVSNGVLVPGANGNAGEFGALFPAGEDRPIEASFLRAAAVDSWADWSATDQGLEAYLDQAARQFSTAITNVLPLLDFEAVYISSRMPREVLQALCDRIAVTPLGIARFGGPLAAQNNPPVVLAHHVPNYAQLACRMAVEAALSAPPT